MTIQPLFNNVLIKPAKREEKTAGGIILPETVNEKLPMGEVLAIGDGEITPKGDKKAMVVKIGDKIVYKNPSFGDGAGTEVKVNGEMCILLDQKNILAIIK